MSGRHVTAGELDARLVLMDKLITRLGEQVSDHERWHRDITVRADEAGAARRLSVWAVVIAAVAAIAAMITAMAALVH